MAERLYLQDVYLASFSARIVERVSSTGREAVILDHTAFFPGMNGLPGDRGWIDKAQVTEVEVRVEDNAIVHVLSEEIWKDQVQARINWPRRLDLMQQHTAGHLLADALAQASHATVVGVTVNEEEAFLDLDRNNVSTDQIEQAEIAANEAVSSNRAIRTAVVSAAQAAKIGLVPLSPEGYLLPGSAPVQIISVEGASPALCEGMHVARTSEVGLIKVIGIETQGKRLRVRFVCGTRALTEFRRLEQALAQIAGKLAVPSPNVLPAIAQLMSGLSATQTELDTVRRTIAGFEADALAASAEAAGGAYVVHHVFAERDMAELRQLARLIVKRPGCVAMLGTAGHKAQLILARSADVRHDMAIAIRIAAQVLNTQGGGQSAMAETIPARADEARVEAAILKAIKWLQAQQ